jgi:hypothetical protein
MLLAAAHQLLAQGALAGQLLAEDGSDGQPIQHQLLRGQAHAQAQLPAGQQTSMHQPAQHLCVSQQETTRSLLNPHRLSTVATCFSCSFLHSAVPAGHQRSLLPATHLQNSVGTKHLLTLR